ncbi:MAG TPA: ATP-binding protein [Sediminibacterium sp.]|nr:ATP-binding protein [Sediminibacterium sp.]
MKKIPVFFFLLIGLLPISHLTAQDLFRQLKMEHWDATNGMPNDLVLNVYQTKDGFIWMTGYAGLTRFDGISFTSFNSRTVPLMKTDNIESLLCETSDSTLWIPTPNSGILSYKKGVFNAYTQYTKPLFLIGKSDHDQLLLSTGRGSDLMILFDTQTKSYKKINSVETDSLFSHKIILALQPRMEQSGGLWLLGRDYFKHLDGGKLETVRPSGSFSPEKVMDLYVDSRNRSWAVAENGLFIWNGKSFQAFPGMEKISFMRSASSTGSILEDRRNGIWVTTAKGVAYLGPKAERFAFYPATEPLLAQSMNNLIEDREGNIWFSSAKGLIKLSYSKFINYSRVDGLAADKVSAVCVLDNNHYMVGSGGKLAEIVDGQVKPYVFRNKALQHFVSEQNFMFRDSKNDVWVCYGSQALLRISKSGEKMFQLKGIAQPRYVFEDQEHQLWFGIAYGGIAFLNKKDELTYLNLPKIDFSALFISSIRKLRNGNWLVTSYNKGAIEIDPGGNPTYFTDASGLKALGVFNSYEDPDGTVWFTTQSGLARLRNDLIQHIDFSSGLPENSLFQFIPDRKGYVWFPSNHGLIRAQKQELNAYLDKQIPKINWQLYDDGDGMLNRQCVGARHSAVTPDGRLLIQTFGGLLEVDPDKLQKNTVLPVVTINRMLVDNTAIDLTQSKLIEPGNHRFVFDYSGLSLVAPQKVKFKFKLIGYDKDFISAAGDRKAFYTNIGPGKYTFQVIACNNDGLWNTTGASYAFSIAPFFYETVWFKILSLALLLLLAWLLVRWRTASARMEKEKLEKVVAMRTSELNKANKELSHSLDTLKATQAQLIQAEKMASLGELTAGIAHEIQNPLNFVNNFSEINKELLAEMNGEIEKGHLTEVKSIAQDVIQNEEKINHHGKRADAIVKGMLQHSRASSGAKESTDINALCDEYLRLAYHGLRAKDKSFNAVLKTEFDASIGKINIVPQDIGRVILNLITNAFYAVDEKRKSGTGTPEGESYQPSVTISTKKQNSSIVISVKDNGNGIPDTIKEKIFQPFFTTKPTGQGTGLGLSLSYDIVKAHGGELSMETAENQYTRFIISLPLKSSPS